ncbi:proteoglycan 4-like [Juglans microcarpa x Juglans regia]|uniref:proteoglycan 4-like n=1 Tax=Juglans microcarpa x Juglans regia TaxID=2249226 RepID=UPI001B7DF24A|nr:proteoglycan 4-like [Juglans microcarpa x Juglans regia]
MDPNSTPFPGKSHPLKPKTSRKSSVVPNTVANALPISRQRRVFGTVRNGNLLAKTATQKPIMRPSSGFAEKPPKSTQNTPKPMRSAAVDKKSPTIIKPSSEFAEKQPKSTQTTPKPAETAAVDEKSPATIKPSTGFGEKQPKSTQNSTQPADADAVDKKSPAIVKTSSGFEEKQPISTQNTTQPADPAAVEMKSPAINKTSSGFAERQPKSTQNTPQPADTAAVKKKSPAIIKSSSGYVEKQPKSTQNSPQLAGNAAVEKKSSAIIKTSSGFAEKQPNSTQNTPQPAETAAVEKKSPEKARPRLKKIVSFPDHVEEKAANTAEAENAVAPRTPVASASLTRPKIPGTPYHSAGNCSKCRFDRLETSSYWLNQIKLSESVGKHFVSAAFFRLAFESKAEPLRNLRVELKRYLARHGCLSEQTEWRVVSDSYGLSKHGSNTGGVDSGMEQYGMSGTSETNGDEGDMQGQTDQGLRS